MLGIIGATRTYIHDLTTEKSSMRSILRLGCAACTTALAMPAAALFACCLCRTGKGPHVTRRPDTARDILDARYARGEIEREEYLQRKEDLSRS